MRMLPAFIEGRKGFDEASASSELMSPVGRLCGLRELPISNRRKTHANFDSDPSLPVRRTLHPKHAAADGQDATFASSPSLAARKIDRSSSRSASTIHTPLYARPFFVSHTRITACSVCIPTSLASLSPFDRSCASRRRHLRDSDAVKCVGVCSVIECAPVEVLFDLTRRSVFKPRPKGCTVQVDWAGSR